MFKCQFRRLLKTDALLTIAAIATIAKAIVDVTVVMMFFLSFKFVLSFIKLMINVATLGLFFSFDAAKVRTFLGISTRIMPKNIKTVRFVDHSQIIYVIQHLFRAILS